MRNLMTAALVLLTAAVLTAMASLGGAPEGEVPKTDENIKVQVTDRSGMKVELTRFSMDGKVFLEGKRGAGVMSVYFHDLREVGFGPASGDTVPAELQLKSGLRLQLGIRTGAVFYGDTGVGAYQISAPDVNRIHIH
ncbi:hypothetical protein [Geomonas anaerohicana]|uniref:Uncharacterized protein n=1 Tax=Geomonas anaerohicana TaxID=2798583 RepID=A0ABS0YGG0_9BACT|nr:hypothetical protein [Geomonas anaerohicana]MBJ6751385.1 hypothetical protein [Geomonas anaerohicana]